MWATNLRYIRFGPFLVDQDLGRLTKNGVCILRQGKAYRLLVALIESQGEPVAREELYLKLWPSLTPTSAGFNLSTTVTKLRKVMDDTGSLQRYIETIPRKGYRLMVPTEFTDIPSVQGVVLVPRSADNAGRNSGGKASPKSNLRIALGAGILLLASMLLGAAITKLWLHHL